MFVRPLDSATKLPILRSIKPDFLLRSLSPESAFLLFRQRLRSSPLPPPPCDHFAYTFLLPAASQLHGLQLHARLLKSGLHADSFIQNSLLSFYSSDLASARRVFAGISGPDVVSWTALVSALARGGRDEEALAAFRAMDSSPNARTLVSALPACSRLGDARLGRAVHGFGLRHCGGHGGNLILDNALLDMYMCCGHLASAHNLFAEMPNKDVVSWTTLISGLADNGIAEEAVEAFCGMLRDGLVEPNEGTIASVLRACALLGGLSAGKAIHGYMLKSRIGAAALIPGNALVNMYAKCGETSMAWRAFDGLSGKDPVSWSTMMWGFAMSSSRAEHALQLFASMLRRGFAPDGVAFLAVLWACCHAGLVDKGMKMLASMSDVYGIVAGKEHYTCVMDALGRAGRLKEAAELILGMPFDADAQARGVLLSAYKMHGSLQLEDREEALGSELGAGGGTYALVSNILADAGRYEESNYVRHLMELRKVKKEPGCSRLQVH